MNKNYKVKEVLGLLTEYIEAEKFKGWDAYDALNSNFLLFVSLGNKYIKAAFTQFFRMSSWNFRPLFGIKKEYNPKGIGLFLESYTKLYAVSKSDHHRQIIDQLLGILQDTISPGYKGNSWGYNFPWQSRVVFKPRWTPTIVNTSFIGHALITCYEVTGSEKALELVKSIPEWMLNDLNRLEVGDGSFCFSYSPMDREFVHNANMLGASFLLRFGKVFNRPELVPIAHNSLKYSIDLQEEDGAWYFANVSTHKWVDSFHTGFKLESIRWFNEFGEGERYTKNYEKGIRFYKDNFFLEDGTPKYYHDRVYPIDIHAPAEAIYFFSKFDDAESVELTARVSKWVIENMFDDERKYFYFRKTKTGISNKIPYMRWSESWMLRGLSEYHYNSSKKNG